MTYDLAVIGGGGHVGLPLALFFADKGKNVLIIDPDKQKVEQINKGIMPFFEKGADEVLKRVVKNKKIFATIDPKSVNLTDIYIYIIGTPVDKYLAPETKTFFKALNVYKKHFNNNSTFILRSTVYPGVSNKVNTVLKDKKINVAFCPERIIEGESFKELKELPQIISSFTKKGIEVVKELFSLINDDMVVVDPIEAELAKLYSNAWRYIKFATANYFYMLANDAGLDYYRIYHAMMHNYKRNKELPQPGFAAGPCLFKDTMQLEVFSENNYHIGDTAMLINEGLPKYLISRLKNKYDLSTKTVSILGMSFKKDSDDIRESLSYKLKKLLMLCCKEVITSDENVEEDDGLVPTNEAIKNADIIIVATPHTIYKNLKIPKNKIVVDIWNLFNKGGLI